LGETVIRWALVGAFLVGGGLLAEVWVDPDYERAANAALLLLAGLVTAFTVLYGTGSAWWTNRIGRIYLVKCVVLSLVLSQVALTHWWDVDYPGSDHVRFAIYTLGAAVYLPMLWTLWREQRRDRRE
jgi:hypothetical protein